MEDFDYMIFNQCSEGQHQLCLGTVMNLVDKVICKCSCDCHRMLRDKKEGR